MIFVKEWLVNEEGYFQDRCHEFTLCVQELDLNILYENWENLKNEFTLLGQFSN